MDDRVKNELKKGLESANQLRGIFNDPLVKNREFLMASLNHHSCVVLDTFETAITLLKNNAQFSDFGLDAGFNFSTTSSTIFNHPILYDNYSRTDQSQPVKVIKRSSVIDDGYCWRKYGRKPIANTKHPREYYRCGYQGQGCQARKQVQIVSENPTKYGIIYYGHHTCQNISKFNPYASQFDHLFNDSYDNECPNMLNFAIAKQGPNNNVMKQDQKHMLLGNEDIPKLLLTHEEKTPSLLSSSSSLSSDNNNQSISLDEWVQDLVNEDVELLPKWSHSIESPLFTNEDFEYLMTHVLDFDRD